MSTIYIDPHRINSKEDLHQLFQQKKLKRGDDIKIVSDLEKFPLSSILILVIVVLLVYLKVSSSQRENYGQKIINDIVGDKSTEELEKEIEEEYGITIEVEQKDEFREEWNQFAAKGLADTYGENEPDYSDVELIEKNPDYQGPAKI